MRQLFPRLDLHKELEKRKGFLRFYEGTLRAKDEEIVYVLQKRLDDELLDELDNLSCELDENLVESDYDDTYLPQLRDINASGEVRNAFLERGIPKELWERPDKLSLDLINRWHLIHTYSATAEILVPGVIVPRYFPRTGYRSEIWWSAEDGFASVVEQIRDSKKKKEITKMLRKEGFSGRINFEYDAAIYMEKSEK